MHRRRVLAVAGLALTGCLDGARQESGPRNPPSTPPGGPTPPSSHALRIVDAGVVEADDGAAVAEITVENDSQRRASGTLIATLTVGGTSHEQRQTVSVDAGTEATARLSFDVAYETYREDGSLSITWDE